MSRSEVWNSSISIALHTLLLSLLILGIGVQAKAAGPGSGNLDLSATCEFKKDEQVSDSEFSGPGLLVTGAVTSRGGAAVTDPLCGGGITITLEEQGKGPWTPLPGAQAVGANLAADGSFSQLMGPLCNGVTENPDATVVRAVVSVQSSCADGSTKTLVTRCTDADPLVRGNRPAVKLESTLDAMCADVNI